MLDSNLLAIPDDIAEQLSASSPRHTGQVEYGQIKSIVRSFQDVQDARLRQGNRVLQAALASAGYASGTKLSDEDAEKLGGVYRDKLLADYDHIRAIAAGGSKKGSDVEIQPKQLMTILAKHPTPNGLLANYIQYQLAHTFRELETAEHKAELGLGRVLKTVPVYTEYLSKVLGCGVALSGAIIAEIDISKAQYASSLWAYAGYDVAGDGRGRSKRKEHLIDVTYTDKDGKQQTRVGITFNPQLRTKLFVLGTSFIKLKDSPYRKIYDDYKNRLVNHPVYGTHNDGKEIEGKGRIQPARRHMMAMRYMLKRFLVDLYAAWRAIEGLPVAPEYSVAKLGLVHGSAEKYAA